MTTGGKLLTALINGVNARSSGLSTITPEHMREATWFLQDALMFAMLVAETIVSFAFFLNAFIVTEPQLHRGCRPQGAVVSVYAHLLRDDGRVHGLRHGGEERPGLDEDGGKPEEGQDRTGHGGMDDQLDQLKFPRREKGAARLLQLDPGPEHEQGQPRADVGEHLERHVQPWGQPVQLREDEKHRQKAGEKEEVPEQPKP